MGAFFLVNHAITDGPDPLYKRLTHSFAQRGYRAPLELRAAGCSIAIFPKLDSERSTVAAHVIGDGSFCASTGTLLYQGLIEAAAMRRLYEDLISHKVRWEALYGNFCILFANEGQLHVFGDRLGVYPVWCSREGRVLSSSFLAVAEATNPLHINPQGVYEYVFNGATFGGESVFQEVVRLEGSSGLQFPDGVTAAYAPELPRPSEKVHFDEAVRSNVANLRRYFDAIVDGFGTRIDSALSGGYDSRLLLALLMERNIVPRLHVYGRADDPDVVVAQQVAKDLNLPLEHIDKSDIATVDPETFRAIVGQNYRAFDALPPDGILDNGTDLSSRRARDENGSLMLNGGGGEIYRNFFYLPNGSYAVRDLVWAFYSRFAPGVCTSAFDERKHHEALERKIQRAASISGGRLERRDIEMLYVTFRCRYWMGLNNGINNALGYALTPFIDSNVVPDATATPIRFKNFGRLEAAMIRSISPRLAAVNSAYGHSFDQSPSLRHKMGELSTMMRPAFVRRYSYRMKNWLHGRQKTAWTYYYENRYLKSVIFGDFPYMKRFVKVEQVSDGEQFNRLCTLEYLFQQTNAVAS